MAKETEACGRCSMSVVVDAVGDEEDEEGEGSRSPFSDAFIEVDDREFFRVSPAAWLSRVSSRIDSAVNRRVWKR